MRERTNELWWGCSFSFFSSMKYYTDKGRDGQDKQIKTCRKMQHVKIDMERGAPNLAEQYKENIPHINWRVEITD